MADQDTRKRGILIIDDDVDILLSVIQILRDEGYSAAGAENGLDGMRLLRAEPKPGLVLLDLMMPVMNGWQFCAEKEQDPVLAEIPVVVISGDGGIDRKAASVGAAGYLKKPIELDVLLETVAQYCTQ